MTNSSLIGWAKGNNYVIYQIHNSKIKILQLPFNNFTPWSINRIFCIYAQFFIEKLLKNINPLLNNINLEVSNICESKIKHIIGSTHTMCYT